MATQAPPPNFRPGYSTCSSVSDLCPIQFTIYGSYFNLGGNLFFLISFFLALLAHSFLGFRHRLWSFTPWVLVAAVMETLGYLARTIMHFHPWSISLVSIQICGLLWGPTLISAGTSIMFKDIVYYCGIQYSVLPPFWIPYVFIGTDVLTVVIQGIGGIIASVSTGETAGDDELADVGEGMIIAGVVFQVVHMAVCGALMLIFMWRYKRGTRKQSQVPTANSGTDIDTDAAVTTQSSYALDKATDPSIARTFPIFTRMLSLAFLFIWVRSIYRVPEMAGGWANPIMRDETSFFVLDSTMITLAIWILVFFHPGVWFRGAGKQNPGKNKKQETETDAVETNVVVDSSATTSDSSDTDVEKAAREVV